MFDLSQSARARTHTKPKSAVLRLIVSLGWSITSPITDTHTVRRIVCGGEVRKIRHQKKKRRKEKNVVV